MDILVIFAMLSYDLWCVSCCWAKHYSSRMPSAGMEPSADPIKRLQPAETVQQIRARPAAPAADEPDLSARHNGLARGLRSMRHRSLLTDATVLLEGYRYQWPVHRLVLAVASRVFRNMFEDTQQTGRPQQACLLYACEQLRQPLQLGIIGWS